MRRVKQIVSCVPAVAFLYAVIAGTVFAFRHPWATDTEAAVHVRSVLCFEKVPYDVMRPREGK
ncbi:unnamed protein product [Gemmata massiliana]|uniref:Uncharacterized protein n=1 Tax=Gemmata massiliana TaxID=1210884 RepID=A0A6P2DM19_9BACT|nr:hypothetical protein [Gemmata massiliana]VTS03578.1 unnamed protein product [Gemmata massiliana]